MLGLHVFRQTGPPRGGRLLGPANCLPHKIGDLPKDATSNLADLFYTLSLYAERQAGKL